MLSRRTALAIFAVPALRGQQKAPAMFADAEAYERFMGRWSRLLAPQLVDFAGAPDSGQYLDIGSGTGALAFAIAQRKTGAHIVGIDPSQEYVEYANSKNSFRDRVKFEPGDAQQMRFPDSTFHDALSLLVFNFIPDSAKALREARRVTRPGGAVSAAVWEYGAGMRMLRIFWDAAVSQDSAADKLDEKHMPLCRAGELANLWRQGGLESVSEQPLEIAMHFASFADYWDPFLLGQGPAGSYVRGLDNARRQAVRAGLMQRLSITREDTPFTLTARALAVRGTVPAR